MFPKPLKGTAAWDRFLVRMPPRGSRSVCLVPEPRPLRIVHLGKYYPPSPGGIENVTRTLAQDQARRGHHVRVVVINHAAADGRDATFEKLTRTKTVEDADGPVTVVRVGRWGNLAKLDVAPALANVLRRELRDPPDIWHLHTPNVTMMLAVAAMSKIRSLVIQHHSDIVRQRYLRHAVRPLERIVYGRAARILPTSAAYAEGSDLLKAYAAKVRPVPLGIDLTPFAFPSPRALDHAERLRAEHGSPLWLSVGRLIYYKGLDVGLDALTRVPGKWLVVGTGPLEETLRARAKELGVADRVVWLRRTSEEELVGAYHAATAFWFPSVARSEGFGLVQVEAMASGCPVINTAIAGSGVPWVSPHEVSGLTVHVNDAAAFAAAARRLLDEPGLRERLVTAGRARAVAEFDFRGMTDRCEAAYREALAEGGQGSRR
jgi:glycosyltransferase involved in cell wall biosynthesis